MIDGLTYDDASHTYRMHGVIVPSVTQILAPLSDFSGVPADVMASASAFGSAVHKMCELYDRDQLDESTLDPELQPYLNAWRQFYLDSGAHWDGIEEVVYHPTMRYAGTLDRRGFLSKGPSTGLYVVDIKTTAELYPSVGPQLAAYRQAMGKENYGRMAVQLMQDGTYNVKIYHSPGDWPVFASLVTLNNWCNQHDITPNFK